MRVSSTLESTGTVSTVSLTRSISSGNGITGIRVPAGNQDKQCPSHQTPLHGHQNGLEWPFTERMKHWPFTESDVDYLVSESKFIKFIPTPQSEGAYWIMRSGVYRRAEPNTVPIPSLAMTARVIKAVPGLPRQLPGAALFWHGYRIVRPV